MDKDIQSLASAACRQLSLLSQDTRLIEIDAPALAGVAGGLVVERFEGTESVCADFRFAID